MIVLDTPDIAAFDQGKGAYLMGRKLNQNPFDRHTPSYDLWFRGWKLEKADHAEARLN